MGRRGGRRGSQGRAQGRARGRSRERVQGRPQGRGSQSAGRQRAALDVDAIEGYANRLRGQLGGSSSGLGSGSGLGGASGLGAAASGLAGAASGLAGGSLASRLTGGEGSDEDFRNEVRERLDLIDERVQRLEDEVARLIGEGEAAGDLAEPEGEPGPEASQ